MVRLQNDDDGTGSSTVAYALPMSPRRLGSWSIVIIGFLFGLWLVLSSAGSFMSAAYLETEVALDKHSTAPIHKLIESGALDLDKAVELALGAPPGPDLNQFQRHHILSEYLFANDLRLEARSRRELGVWFAAHALVTLLLAGAFARCLCRTSPGSVPP